MQKVKSSVSKFKSEKSLFRKVKIWKIGDVVLSLRLIKERYIFDSPGTLDEWTPDP